MLGDRRIFTAASLRDPAGLRAPVVVAGLARTVVGAMRGDRAFRVLLLPSDLAAAARVAGFLAVRIVRAVVLFAATVRRVVARGALPAFVRLAVVSRVLLVAEPVERAADFRVDADAPVVARAATLRPLPARVVAVRFAGPRTAAFSTVAVRLAVDADFARVVFFTGVLVAVVLVAAAFVLAVAVLPVRTVEARVVFVRPVGVLAARVAFGIAFEAGFFVAAERVKAVFAVRVVRAVLLRGLVPAVRRPPARMAIARLGGPSWLLSLLILNLLFLEEDGGGEGGDRPGPDPARIDRIVNMITESRRRLNDGV